jgi:Mn2+/Fe2+ NRAMP family transporter
MNSWISIRLGMHATSLQGFYGLPVVLIFILLRVNDRNLMQSHTNGRVFNAVAWLTTVIMIALTVVLLVGGALQA